MAYADGDSGPEGIGGWLALFMFGFCGVSPIVLIFGSWKNLYGDATVAYMLGDRWLAYQIAEWIIIAVSLAVIGYIAWRLINVRNALTVRLTIFAIPFLAVGTSLLDILASTFIGGIDAGLLFSVLGVELVRGVIYSAIWCSYFYVSKRVKATYSKRPVDDTYLVFE